MRTRRPPLRGRAATPVVLLVDSPQDPVKARFRGEITALIGQRREKRAGRQAPIRLAVRHRQDFITLGRTQLVGRGRPVRLRSPIRDYVTVPGPALIGPYTDSQHRTRLVAPCTGGDRFVDQRHRLTSVRMPNHASSSSPQIAWAFSEDQRLRGLGQRLVFTPQLALQALDLLTGLPGLLALRLALDRF